MAQPPDFVALSTLTAAQMNLAGAWVVKRDTIASGASSATISDAFNADFTHYRVVIHNISVAAGTPAILFQLRTGLSTATTTYFWGGTNSNYINRTDENSAGTTSSWKVGYANTTNATMIDCMIYRPFDAAASAFYSLGASTNASTQLGGVHNTATSYDQLVISLSTATTFNATATVIIIGLRD
jgi:hypothetical protein